MSSAPAITADDTLVPGSFPKYFRALKDAMQRLESDQLPLVSVYIWRGRLIAKSTRTAYMYRVLPRPCSYCGCAKTEGEAEDQAPS